jgi:hypothetical protein
MSGIAALGSADLGGRLLDEVRGLARPSRAWIAAAAAASRWCSVSSVRRRSRALRIWASVNLHVSRRMPRPSSSMRCALSYWSQNSG